MNPPTPMATYCEPSYGAGTGAGRGSAIELTAPGVDSPLDSAQSARSMPDSAIARACALFMWFMAMAGSLELKARKATVSAVSNVRMMSVIGSAMPSSDPRRRASRPFIDSSGERGLRTPPVGSPGCSWPGLRSEEHTSELQSHSDLVCRLLLEKKNYDEG